jgi:hypothetical protein
MIRQAVMPTCQTFVDVWQELNQPLTADSAEVEFNLGFTASGNAVIMQASGQASFKVKVSWKFVSGNNSSPPVNVDDGDGGLSVPPPDPVSVSDGDPILAPTPPPAMRREEKFPTNNSSGRVDVGNGEPEVIVTPPEKREKGGQDYEIRRRSA